MTTKQPDKQTGRMQVNFRLNADHHAALAARAEQEGRTISGLVKVLVLRGLGIPTRPDGADTYLLEGAPHRFDGACHPGCPNVR